MDEPFSGLDPVNVATLKDAFLEMKHRGTTIVFSSHQMEMVEELCQDVVIIDRGHVVIGGSVRDVRRSTGRQVVRLAVDGDVSMPWLASIPGVRVVRPGEDYTELDVTHGVDPETVLQAALDRHLRVTEFVIADPSIEDIFIEKVGRRPTDAPGVVSAPGLRDGANGSGDAANGSGDGANGSGDGANGSGNGGGSAPLDPVTAAKTEDATS
jgi:ABC-2 type transport system ATP-binding protein